MRGLWLGLILLCGTGSLKGAEPVRHVVVISVDGLPASMIQDPGVPLESIRALARDGVVASGMTPSNPSVTWPNHTSLVSGARPIDHGVLYNGVMERTGPGLPVRLNSRTDGKELVHVPTLPDAIHAAGKTVVGINWPCTRNSPSFLVDFPDTPDTMKYTTPQFIDEMIEAGIVPADIRNSFGKLPPVARDRVWTDAACLAIRKYRPALTLLHLLNVDALHHRYGPGSWPGNTAVAYADACVGKVIRTLDEIGIRDQTAVFIVSDHGFQSIPKTIHPNVLLRQNGLLTAEGNQITSATAQSFAEGGIAMVFLTRRETRDADRQRVIELFRGKEGIADIITQEQFADYGMPDPEEYPSMGDLILVGKDGYGFSNNHAGELLVSPSEVTVGTHGFLSTNPKMAATFVASGAGIQTGAELKQIENTQVAPTIAKLLNVSLPSAKGKAIDSILSQDVSHTE